MFTRTLLFTAFAAALAVAPAQADVTDSTRAASAACLEVDQDLMQPGMARKLVFSGSASVGTHQSSVITYNGHAGLGASVYQHNQTDREFLAFSGVQDGTSNTIMFGARAADGPGADFILMADMGGQFF